MKGMELIDSGTVFERGKGSRAIPIKAHVAKLKGDVKVGDPYQIWSDNGELKIVFPKASVQQEDGEIFEE